MRSWFSSRFARRFTVIPTMFVVGYVVFVSSLGAAPGHGPSNPTGAMEQDWYMVVDRAGILDEGQERSAINDAYRLNLYGIPTQVITEPVGLNQVQANSRADELRTSNSIESFPGANDGLLLYTSVDPYDQSNIVMSISTGSQTLPRNGLDVESLERVRDGIMTDQLAQGHPARAIVYSLREMIYLEQYVPPPALEVSGWRSRVNGMVDVLGPMLAVAAVAWLIHNRRQLGDVSTLVVPALLAMSTVAVVIIVMAVVSRSAPGVLSAGLLGGVAVWLTCRLDRGWSRGRVRGLAVTPRPPGSRGSAVTTRTSRP